MRKFGLVFENDGTFLKTTLSSDEFEQWSNKRGYKTFGDTVYPKGFNSDESVLCKKNTDHFSKNSVELIYI